MHDAAHGDLALGARLRVWWPTASIWFAGTITAIRVQDEQTITHVVYDEDGDVAWHDLADRRVELIQLYSIYLLSLYRSTYLPFTF